MAGHPATIAADEYVARRRRVLDEIGPGAAALLQGAPPAKGFKLFRQSNETQYLCGAQVPLAYLLLDGRTSTCTLFVPGLPAGQTKGTVPVERDTPARLRETTGVDAVLPAERLAEHLRGASVVYTPHSPAQGEHASRDELTRRERAMAADPWDGGATREAHFIGLLRTRLQGVEIRDLCPILDAMRIVKSPAELELCRRAARLSALAVAQAMRATRPGLTEGALEAIAHHVYHFGGARGAGYRAIVPSGVEHCWDGHYFANDGELREGDLVLMDTAPDYEYYTSDIGRMWPVSGTYAAWQRELYGFVVEYHKTLLGLIRPSVMAEEILAEAREKMTPVVDASAWSKPQYEAAARAMLEFRGHLSHPVGMAVHDDGDYWSCPLRPGTVFTVDPQMWVREDTLYIRVEDTVAVTGSGVEALTASAPLELDDVEVAMREETAFPLDLRAW